MLSQFSSRISVREMFVASVIAVFAFAPLLRPSLNALPFQRSAQVVRLLYPKPTAFMIGSK